MSECDNCKNKKNWPCPNTCGYMGTCDGWEPKPMTKGDRIRAMSDEELAEKIGESIDCEVCKTMHHSESGECPCRPHQSCVDFWLDWLKQEARDD